MAIVYTDEIHYQNIAKSIREKNGSTTKYSPSEMSAAIDAITVGTGGNELDTSDATATENDIALNKTAYVDGEKITGTLSEVGSDSTLIVPLYSESSITDNFVVKGEIDSDRIFRENGKVEMHVPFSDFGTASKEDVAAGKTFTSKDGFVETGTHVCDGGLDTSDATATEQDILMGKTAYTNGTRIEGQMRNNGSVMQHIRAGDVYTIPQGYHSGKGTVATQPLSDQTQGTAQPEHILLDEVAWVNGVEITGTMSNNEDVSVSLGAGESYIIPQGHHSGSGIVTSTPLSDQTQGSAQAGDILLNKTAWVNGTKVAGTMPNANVRYNTSSFEITNDGVVKGNIYCDTAGYQSIFGTDGVKSTLGTIPIYYNTAVNIIAGESDTVIPAGTYVPYKVTVKGDTNLQPGNIKSGVSIFGVTGEYVGKGTLTEDFQGKTDANGDFSFYVGENVGEIAFLWIGILTGSSSNQYDSFVYSTFSSSLVDFRYLYTMSSKDYFVSNTYPEVSVSVSGRTVTVSGLDVSRNVNGSIVYVQA